MKNVLSRIGAASGFCAIWMGAYVALMPGTFSGSAIETKASVAKSIPPKNMNVSEPVEGPRFTVVEFHRAPKDLKHADSM